MSRSKGNTGDATSLEDFKLRQLVYGSPGSGKTWYASTAPKPFFISIDQGLTRLKMVKKDVEYEEVDSFEDIKDVLNDIYSGKAAKGRKTIVLDHISEATDLAKTMVMQQNGAVAMNLKLWGQVSDEIRGLIKKMDGLRKFFHIITLAQEQIVEDKGNDSLVGLPNTVGKFASQIGAYYDLFLYAQQETLWEKGKPAPHWKLYPFNVGRYTAKDGLGILSVAEPNDFETIYSKFKERVHNATS